MTENNKENLTSRTSKVAYSIASMIHTFKNEHSWKEKSFVGLAGQVGGATAALYYGFMPALEQVGEFTRPYISELADADMQKLATYAAVAATGAVVGIVGARIGEKLGKFTGYAAYDVTRFTVGTSCSFTFGMLKKGYNGLKSLFTQNRDKMTPEAAAEMDKHINVLDEALQHFKDDELMVTSLASIEHLTASEFKDLKNNYQHLIEARETKAVKDGGDLAYVFKEMSLGKVGQIFNASGMKPKVVNEAVQDVINNLPTLNELVDMTLKKTEKIYFSEGWAQVYHDHTSRSFDDCMKEAASEVVKKNTNFSDAVSESVVKRVFADAYKAAELSEPKLIDKINEHLHEEVKKEEANIADAADRAGDPDFIAEQHEQAWVAKNGPI